MTAHLRAVLRQLRRWAGMEPRALLDGIKGSEKAEERDRGVDQVMNDIEVLKREAEWHRRWTARELGRR